MGNYVKKKKEMVFQSVDSLQQVVNVVNEAAMAVNDKTRTIRHSAIPEVLTGALGAGIGGVGSFLALYGLGTVGLSAAGITSGLAAAGAIVGGGMVAGVFVLAAPVAALAAGGVGIKVDDFERLITMQDGTKIPMDDILSIDGELFLSLE